MLPPGVYPASVTPLTADHRVDELSLARLLASFEDAGCQGVVIAGTNGEGPSLSAPAKRDLLAAAVTARGGLKVILGIASNALGEAIWLTKQAAKLQADACLVMAPSYFREASQEGVAQWFDELLAKSPVPVLVYNFPKRTGVTFTAEMIERWSHFDAFAGLKDSSGERANLASFQVPDACVRFVGDETLLYDALQAGWTGTISGLANVMPSWLAKIVREFPDGSAFQLAESAMRELRSLPQPAVHKAVLANMGILASPTTALPLESASSEHIQRASAILQDRFGIRASGHGEASNR